LAFRARLAELERDGEDSYQFNRKAFDELILRKMYVVPSFEIHNGPAGLFDYGPPACTLKANVINSWRNHFVVEENMLEMECTNLTPSSVLETSGHVERFTDFMVRDEITGECFRADKLLEDSIDNFIASHPEITVQEKEEHRIIQVFTF
jgi:glycyl-tRNA synthetase